MKLVQQDYVPGTSRKPRSNRTLALRMAFELQRQQEVAERIRELRGKIPQPVIAERVGVTLRAYQEWEAGGGLKWSNYGKLATALGTTVEYLMSGDEEARVAPPPDAQLERIEAKLDALLAHFNVELDDPATRFEAGAEQAGQPPDERDESPAGDHPDEDAAGGES